jgi:methyl-accepting chemotaxis protein
VEPVISNGAANLAKRTEQQAASLEETAAALNEITEEVSSENARTAAASVNLASPGHAQQYLAYLRRPR